MEGVLVSEGKFVATDGRILLYANAPTIDDDELPPAIRGERKEAGETTIIPSTVIKRVSKVIPKSKFLPCLNSAYLFANEIVSSDLNTTVSHSFAPLDGTYPNYKQVLPDRDRAEKKIRISVDLLEIIVKAMKKTKCDCVTFGVDDERDPISVHMLTKQGEDIKGCAMPMRLD
jgi:DNA polymerase III sliding clamp (beta) subunit (PCNA family)